MTLFYIPKLYISGPWPCRATRLPVYIISILIWKSCFLDNLRSSLYGDGDIDSTLFTPYMVFTWTNGELKTSRKVHRYWAFLSPRPTRLFDRCTAPNKATPILITQYTACRSYDWRDKRLIADRMASLTVQTFQSTIPTTVLQTQRSS